MTTLRDQLLAAKGTPAGSLALPELGGVTVHLRRWSLGDRIRMQALSDDARKATEKLPDMLRLCLANPDNTPLFPDGDDAVLEFPGDVADRVIDAALEANGLGPKAVERGKAGSPGTRNSASSAGSASAPAAADGAPPNSPTT